MRILGIPVTIFEKEDMESGLIHEDKDAKDNIEWTKDVVYGDPEGETRDVNGFYAPPKQHWWQR